LQTKKHARLGAATDRHICTDAVVTRLLQNSAALRPVVSANNPDLYATLDYRVFNAFTIKDVIRIHHHAPELLRTVPLPIVPQRRVQPSSPSSSSSSVRSRSLFSRAKRLESQWDQMKTSIRYFAALKPKQRTLISKLYFRKAYLYARPASFVFVHAFLHLNRSLIPFSSIFLKYGTLLTLYLMSRSIVESRKELALIRVEQAEQQKITDSGYNPRRLGSSQVSFPVTNARGNITSKL
jgi:hypothetical protein